MRYDADHKQKTREKVLKAAAKAIRAHGPHRIGVAGVMNQAGLTHGGFYAHFESKTRWSRRPSTRCSSRRVRDSSAR